MLIKAGGVGTSFQPASDCLSEMDRAAGDPAGQDTINFVPPVSRLPEALVSGNSPHRPGCTEICLPLLSSAGNKGVHRYARLQAQALQHRIQEYKK